MAGLLNWQAKGPERAGDSSRVTQQGDAEPSGPGISSSHCSKPNRPQPCLASLLPESQDLKCLSDGHRAAKGQEGSSEGVE